MTGAAATARRIGWALVMLIGLFAVPAMAVEPNERLDDPALETRARAISQELRCLVCRNEAIDDSNADLARDLRLLVRERLTAGDSDAEVKAYVVDRYGEFVLLKPSFSAANMALWLAGPLIFLAGLALSVGWLRRRRPAAEGQPDGLSAEERARLERILDDG